MAATRPEVEITFERKLTVIRFQRRLTSAISNSDLVAAILISGCWPTSARVDNAISESGVVENVG